jgi:hypothetical protein
MAKQRGDKPALPPAFHVSRRCAYEPFDGPNATTRLLFEDAVLQRGEKPFGFPSVASSKAFENALAEVCPARVEA